ncbi:aminotransferase class IV [Compostibacter hankyongensis]|uniref:Aminotransferase class IV family protein n=1 Tax=Compostibacter hankyongensis TaxID=1007089 RepID=A0ABP8FHH4_9BACT
MCRFIESIRWKNEEMPLLSWHEQRFARTQEAVWERTQHPSLDILIRSRRHAVVLQPDVLYKCRVVYGRTDVQISWAPYQKRIIRRLQPVTADKLDYAFKYAERGALDGLRAGWPEDTEPLIIRRGLITDTTFSNLAFFDGAHWLTPAEPLLPGVRRASLLAAGVLKTAMLTPASLKSFTRVRLLNAMMEWEESWELPAGGIF